MMKECRVLGSVHKESSAVWRIEGKVDSRINRMKTGRADGRVHELGGMKRQNVLPKTGKILMRSRKCPVTPANNRICILLHPWKIPLYKAFSIPTRKKKARYCIEHLFPLRV
jgi:porphobilinogen deaminase